MRSILVVDDEWAIADWLQALLDDAGYRVFTAGNGQKALDAMAEHRPDLMVTDFMMPVMDAPALVQAIRRDGMSNVPIIIMSSLPEITVRDRVDGINGFLRKPFTEVELLRMVARCLDGGT
ncbi:MAG: hypothetical protein QOD74_989 [Variibacter sp.]|nr:hypothetical protein [Variibacter sp.]